MKIRIVLYTLLMILAPALSYGQEAPTSTAEVVEVLPALPSLAAPNFAPEAPTLAADPTFPKYLEKLGDLQNALLEWRRVAFVTEDRSLKAQAFFHVGRLYYSLDNPQKAIQSFEDFAARFPKNSRIDQALYYMILSSIQVGSKEVPSLLKHLETVAPQSDWAASARYTYLWHLAQQGNETAFHAQNKQEKQLLQILKPYPADVKEKAWVATLLSFFSGAGHLYLGSTVIALMAFMVNLIFFMAFVHALRHKQWAYSMVLGLIFSCIYFGTIFSSYTLTYSTAEAARLDAMQSWTHMQPTMPEGK